MKNIFFALLVLPAIAWAQDAKPEKSADCDKSADCATASDCETKCGDAKACDTKAACLTTARKDLSTWKTELRSLSRVERDSIMSANKTVFAKSPSAKAIAPTFGATADMLAIMAKLDSKMGKQAMELSNSYRAMAQAIAGKSAYPAPKLSNMEEIKAAMKKAEKDANKATAMWTAAKKTQLSKEDADAVAASMKVLNAGCPRMRALAVNNKAIQSNMKKMKCGDDVKADGDPRIMMMKMVTSLNASSAPFFAKVNMEKPEPMAPAPSS